MSAGRPSSAQLNDPDCWQNLANGVITQAAQDYRHATRTLRRNPKDLEGQNEKKDVETFMRSHWFSTLTEADGDYILRRLEHEAASGERVKYARRKPENTGETTEEDP